MRKYCNCEMVKVDQRDFDEIMSKRVDRPSSLEEFIIDKIRLHVFFVLGNAPYGFCDGCMFLNLNKSGHNDCFFLVRGEFGLLSYYVDDENQMYFMRML